MDIKNLTYIIWDKKSDINGVAPEKAAESLKLKPSDEVYIIKDGERAWMIQTDKNTPFPDSDIRVSAQKHLDSIIADLAKE